VNYRQSSCSSQNARTAVWLSYMPGVGWYGRFTIAGKASPTSRGSSTGGGLVRPSAVHVCVIEFGLCDTDWVG
jgi:hypothetical protein